jgi:hypothetical protein
MVPRRLLLRKNDKYSVYTEFSTLKLLKFTYIIYTADLSIHDLKLAGVGYTLSQKLLLYTLILLTKN